MFFSYKKYHSEKNGTIVVSRFFRETTTIIVNSCQQSGQYIIDMWRHALTKITHTSEPKKILLLGLGGGNVVKLLQEKYPDALITVVEWDEVMITLAKKIGLFSHNENVKIICSDAFVILPTLKESYDLIIIDLFTGEIPPQEMTYSEVLLDCRRLLQSKGLLLVNFYRHSTYRDSFKVFFEEEDVWEFKSNNLALYSQKS